jgi:hypothetical protein
MMSDEQRTLSNYLLPDGTFDDPYIPPIPELPSQLASGSTAIHPFDPGVGLDRRRLPFHVELVQNLHGMMYAHFRELLDDYPAAKRPISPVTQGTMQATRDICLDHRLGDEASVSALAGYLGLPIRLAYQDLTGSRIKDGNQVETERRTVITDRIIYSVANEERGNVLVLWEDKSVRTFARYIGALQDRLAQGPFNLVSTSQMVWENEDAILAKVCTAIPRKSCFIISLTLSWLGMLRNSNPVQDGQLFSVVIDISSSLLVISMI